MPAKAGQPKPPAKRATATKPPVRKAAQKTGSAAKATPKATKGKPAPAAKPAKKAPPAHSAAKKTTAKSAKRPAAPPAKHKPATKSAAKSRPSPAASRPQTPPRPAPRPKPSQDEMAAIHAFERAHKDFSRGRFGEARQAFRALIEQHPHASEVTARARIYLAIAESRLRTETALPRDPDALYDRGVIELNRGDYVAAQELFERALKREPEAAHVHYGLAATRARLGSITPALEALERALNLQPNLRIRAQHDQDLAALRNEPDYERLIFAPRA
ncbi:MAG TPA: tetratricopeptide repeat protein [Pyrinomonadaceae bacterium]|nr:tetratricopeptide repeat protein [Pyrinomonadaceae bacterium]